MNEDVERKIRALAQEQEQSSAILWGFGQASRRYTVQEFRNVRKALMLGMVSGKISPESVEKCVLIQKERNAIATLLERMIDYFDKREECLSLVQRYFKRNNAYKIRVWGERAKFYSQQIQRCKKSLVRIYLKHKDELKQLENAIRNDPKLALYVAWKLTGKWLA
jgi:hypothetical protein